jgi:hypothetical protein
LHGLHRSRRGFPQQWPRFFDPYCFCSALWSSVFDCDERLSLTATAFDDASLDWSTGPKFSTATFGEALTAIDLASAFWEIEFDAFWV